MLFRSEPEFEQRGLVAGLNRDAGKRQGSVGMFNHQRLGMGAAGASARGGDGGDLIRTSPQDVLGFPREALGGVGGLLHLTCELYKKAANVDVLHVPYKGTQFFLPDLMVGQITLAFDTLPIYIGQAKAGKVKILAVTSPTRSQILPEVQTATEAGLPALVSVALYGLFAPAKTPPEVLQLLQREVSVSLNDATLKEKLLGQGIEIESSTPEALRDLLQAEIAKWARVIKDAGITPE